MANIQEDINQIATARYGREVRGSIVNALTLMNEESSEAIDKAVTAQDSASAAATAAANSAGEAQGYAERLNNFGGGTTGQVLTKNSDADYDYSWENSESGTSDAYETTYGDSNVGDTLDDMPRLAGAVQGTSPAPKDADTLGGRYRAEDIDLIKESLAKHELGDVVDLTVNVDYECPSDGYFIIAVGNGVTAYNNGYINGVLISIIPVYSHSFTDARCIYVRKGTRIKYIAENAGCWGNFIPLA